MKLSAKKVNKLLSRNFYPGSDFYHHDANVSRLALLLATLHPVGSGGDNRIYVKIPRLELSNRLHRPQGALSSDLDQLFDKLPFRHEPGFGLHIINVSFPISLLYDPE